MPTTFSHYRILEQIGAGGMGVVYRAHDERLDRDVALKVLSTEGAIRPADRKRFQKEALTLSKLNHPNIATIHDFDTQDGTDFLVEELIEGVSLDSMLISGPLSERELINLGSQMAEGLAAAHEHGVIHRDLKPANVRITTDSRLKILDFGIATILRREAYSNDVTESLSETKVVAGTLPYMAPEQLLCSRLDARTDIWAAGCVLYEMATGRRPFLGSGPALTDAILHSQLPPVSKLNPVISAPIEAVIQKCLDKDPAKRYHSAREIAVDLRRAASAPRTAALRLGLKRSFAALSIVAVVIAAFTIGLRRAPNLKQIFSSKVPAEATAPVQGVPHELYLAGLKQLERWDKSGNPDSAIGLFEQTVKADPDFALGFSGLADAYWAKYRLDRNSQWLDEAEANCRRAAALNNNLPAVYVTLARVHDGKGQYNLALQEIEQALKLEPHDPDALLGAATVYASMGRSGDAESTYKKALALRPDYWGGFYEMGAFYYRQRRYVDATAAFQHALEITPDNAIVHAVLGGMLQLSGENVEAEKHLKRSIELQPSYAAYTNLGSLYYRERRWEESAAMTQKALHMNAHDWRAWSNLGLAYEWMHRDKEADAAFRNQLTRLEEVATINSNDADLQAELGALYAKFQMIDKAKQRIEAALALAPENPNVLATAGEAYEILGDRSRALTLVEQALTKGYTLAELENDPGKREILRDPRFQEFAQQSEVRQNKGRQSKEKQSGERPNPAPRQP